MERKMKSSKGLAGGENLKEKGSRVTFPKNDKNPPEETVE